MVRHEVFDGQKHVIFNPVIDHEFKNFEYFWKVRMADYPSNIAPIGTKLAGNAFQAILSISFLDIEISSSAKF